MKAQSAVEYLTTYGWMLIVVGVVGAAIYGVIDTGCVDSTSGFQGQSPVIDNFGLSSTEELNLVIENRESNSINLSEIRISDANGDRNITLTGSESEIGSGSSEEFSVPAFESSSGCNNMEVELIYDAGVLEEIRASGVISSDISVQDIGSPDPLADLEINQ